MILRVEKFEKLLRRYRFHRSLQTFRVLRFELLRVDDHFLEFSFSGRPFDDLLVDGVGGDQAVHHDWLGLPDSVTAILGLGNK